MYIHTLYTRGHTRHVCTRTYMHACAAHIYMHTQTYMHTYIYQTCTRNKRMRTFSNARQHKPTVSSGSLFSVGNQQHKGRHVDRREEEPIVLRFTVEGGLLRGGFEHEYVIQVDLDDEIVASSARCVGTYMNECGVLSKISAHTMCV